MIQAVIIDDESKGRKILHNFLSKFCPHVHIIGDADGVETGIDLITQKQPELVFLDVEMKDGTGFDLLQKMPSLNFAVIFVTAHSEYALQAFKSSAIDYLLKPVLPEELMLAVNKFLKDKSLKNSDTRLKNLLDNQNEITKLALPTHAGIELLKIKDLIYCESSGNYTSFYTTAGSEIVVSKTIKEYDGILSPHNFFRIHQSYLINLDYVVKFNKNDGGFVTLSNKKQLAVSRRNKQKFLEAILK
jgi:two-component system LytT family response regulator